MGQVITIAKREVTALFYSPIAYLVMLVFLLFEGIFFGLTVFVPGQITELRMLVDASRFGLFFIVPGVTMSVFADEYRSGRIEMLRTSPITELQLLLGKYCGALMFYLALVGLTLIYLVLLMLFGRPDYGQTAVGYFGLIIMGMMFVSVGVFFSACTQNQIVAYLASLLTLGFLTFIGPISGMLPSTWKFLGLVNIPIRSVARYVGVGSHMEDFAKGVIETSHVSYFALFTAMFLFLTYLILESRKWR